MQHTHSSTSQSNTQQKNNPSTSQNSRETSYGSSSNESSGSRSNIGNANPSTSERSGGQSGSTSERESSIGKSGRRSESEDSEEEEQSWSRSVGQFVSKLTQGFKELVAEVRDQIEHASSEEINEALQKAKQTEKEELPFKLIDVREKEEWNQGHLPRAIHLSRGTLESQIEQVVPDKNTPIVTYCGEGSRSTLAAGSLKKMGYRARSMKGGYREWVKSGYSTTE